MYIVHKNVFMVNKRDLYKRKKKKKKKEAEEEKNSESVYIGWTNALLTLYDGNYKRSGLLGV